MTRILPDGYHALAPGKLANVVTFLETTAPPVPSGRPAPAGYGLERVERWTLAEFRRLYVEIGARWLWTSRMLMSDAVLAERLHRPGTEAYVPVTDGKVMGILELDFADPADVELSFFGLVPEAIGGGVGRWLMEEAFRIVWSRSETRRLWLHTCHFDSPQALPFYVRMGFSPYARAVEVHDDPRLIGRLDPAAGPHVPVIAAARLPDL